MQSLGEKTARHPKKQIALNIEPIRVFLQGRSSVVVGGKNMNNTIRNNPSNDMNVRYVMSELRICLGNTAHHLLEQIFDLLYDALGSHIPVKFSFQRFSREDSANSSTP